MISDSIISIQNVGVRFKNRKALFFGDNYFEALKDVSFNIHRGDSVGVIGRNGAGKTTLLRVLGGIIRPDWGKIYNNNVSTALLALQVGFDPELSGRINAVICGMLLGFQKEEILNNMDEIISFSELEEFIDRPVKSYSSGMQARLGFAVALRMSPDVLLIDEVLGVGDASFQKKSLAVMQEKILSDQTIVFVSHSSATVKSLCNRAVWIENGVTMMEGESGLVVEEYEKYLIEHEVPGY